MIVHFGLHLDGMQPAPPRTLRGEVALGPARFLEVLELRLGLPPTLAKPGEALLAYQACLVELDDPTRFYHRSLAVDALAVARTLLDWRAQWHAAGWTGTFAGDVPKRLADMADVERLAATRVPPNFGQRLARVAAALERGLGAGIDRIVLRDDPAELPAAWQRVLARLPAAPGTSADAASTEAAPVVGAAARRARRPSARTGTTAAATGPASAGARDFGAPGTTGDLFATLDAKPARDATGAASASAGVARAASDLERLQRLLLAEDRDCATERAPERLSGDASFVVVHGISRDLTAQTLGEYLLKIDAADDTVVIAEHDGIIVDNALERIGLPRAGFQHYSRFRAVAQVLKLCLGLVWEPLSPHLLLQFLIHPVGPLPDHARATLAEAVAAEPGVGGTAWRAALTTLTERMRETIGRTEKETRALLADIDYWLVGERHAPDPGAPVALLIERAQRCATWLARRLHTLADDHDVALYAAAEAQAAALVAALGRLHERGDAVVKRITLERLVDEVGARAADPATFGQAGHVRATTEPAALAERWGTVVWWDLPAHAPPLSYPWSASEFAALAREGVALPPVAERIEQRMRGWLRPVLCAREQLILVVHDRDAGRHPLLSRIESLVAGFTKVHVESALLESGGRAEIPTLEVPTEALPLAPLPRPRRWWQLPPEARIPMREQESYSSLAKLIYHPHEWVLNYAAKLRPGRAADLPGGNLLNGRLAHRLFEQFFASRADWATLDATTIDAWLADALPRLVTEEGALLCEAGTGVVREQVQTTLAAALVALLHHLRGAGVVSVAAEVQTEAPFKDVTLRGAIDLLLRDRTGRETVLDVKWSGERYRGEELEENRALQLATYAYMRRQATGGHAWPHHAYFIVTTGNVLAHDRSVFPDAIVFEPPAGEDIAALWARAAATYDWRRAQLAANSIEVNAAGTEAGLDSAPAGGLDTNVPPDTFDDFTRLTGWDAGA